MPNMERAISKPAVGRIFSPDRVSSTPLNVNQKREVAPKKEQYYTQEEREQITLRREKLLNARESNTNTLREVGIPLSPKTGRNLIKNYVGIFPTETIKKLLAYVKRRQGEFNLDETPEKREVKKRSDLAEEIIVAELAKCLSEEFYFYRSNLYGDIRGGYDIVAIDRETGRTEFVIDVTLGKNDPNNPINKEKDKKVYQNNRNGVMVYDGYEEQDENKYVPTYDIMTPLLSISLPDRTAKGEDNLVNIIDRMSPSFEEPSKKDFENALYLHLGLMKSLDNVKGVYDPDRGSNNFNILEIQKRAGNLYGMLSPEEKSHWKSVPEEVQLEIEEWKYRIEDLEDKFYEVKNTLAEKAGMDPRLIKI